MKKWQKLAASGAGALAIAAAMAMGWEGGNVHRAYWDAYGHVWTICAGHTDDVHKGDVATDAQCNAYMRKDMGHAAAAVDRCIHVKLSNLERAAFIDAAYNIGPSVVCGSTLQRMANSGNVTGACLQLTDALDKRGNNTGWTYSGGKMVQGLRNRRTDERNLCIGYIR